MWNYEKRLQFPINIDKTDPKMALLILSQYGGPDGESGATLRYLSQRYTMPYREVSGLLTDIATEELAHMEMVSTMVHQLTKNLTIEQIKGSVSNHTTLTTLQLYGHKPLEGFHSMHVNSSQRAMPLRI